MNPYAEALFELLKVIAPSLVTVLLGAFIVQRFFVSRANEAALIDFLIEELDKLRDDALEYWNLAGDTKENKQRQILLTQKIKGNLRALASDFGYFCDRYCLKDKSTITKLLTNLHDSCTGGEFESSKKKADPHRYIIIVNTINDVKSAVFRRKL